MLESFLAAQWVKDLALSLQWLRSLLMQVRSQAWELPYAAGIAKQNKTKQKNKKTPANNPYMAGTTWVNKKAPRLFEVMLLLPG